MSRLASAPLGLALVALALMTCIPLGAREAKPATAPEQQACTPPRAVPPLRIMPAKDGGPTCFTAQDVAILRAYIARCSGER